MLARPAHQSGSCSSTGRYRPGLVVVQTDEGHRPASQNELMRCAAGDPAAAEAIRQNFHNLYDLLCETEGTS